LVRIDKLPGKAGRKDLKTSKHWLPEFFIQYYNKKELLKKRFWICNKCYRKLLKEHNERTLFNVIYMGDTITLSQSLYDLNLNEIDSNNEIRVNNERHILTSTPSVFSKFDTLRMKTWVFSSFF
jgi:hypothetical protein